MSFSLLSPLGFAAGLAALAGALYLLQRLRVRHREVDVPTTLFWHEAVHETRARVLVQRFRHPWAYALALAICALLWGAVGAPEREGAGARRYLFLLDGSAASQGRFSLERLDELLDEVPREDREVVFCGAVPTRLLAPGEPSLLVEARLRSSRPELDELVSEAAPPSVVPVLETAVLADPRPTTAIVLGAAPLDPARLALLPDRVTVEHLAMSSRPAEPNAGITALGILDAASGAWDRVDVLVEVATTGGEVEAPGLAVDGVPVSQPTTRRELGPGLASFVVRDLPARGGRLEARIAQHAGIVHDDSAGLLLPDRRPLRVLLSPSMQQLLGPVLVTDPGVSLVTEEAEVVVRREGEEVGTDLPALELGDGSSEHAFHVTYDTDRDADEALVAAVGDLALGEIDATALAEVVARPISLGVEPGAPRRVAVWEELFGAGYDLRDSRALPLFLAGSLRWLAGRVELVPWVAAGESYASDGALTMGPDVRLDALDTDAVLPWAGAYTTDAGATVEASLLSRDVTLATPPSGAPDPLPAAEAGRADPVTWILLAAFVLLLVEWRQVRLGRMP